MEALTGNRGISWLSLSGWSTAMRPMHQESFVKYGPEIGDDPGYEDQERIAGEILGT